MVSAQRPSMPPIAVVKSLRKSWVLDFGEWASIYRTWLVRQAEYRNEVQRLQQREPSLKGLIQVSP